MASETQVAQLAATLIGSDARISSLDDDRPTARAMKAVWDLSRRAAIADGSWNFAARRAALSSQAGVSPDEIYPFAYRYPMPAQALRLIEVLDVARINYQLEGSNGSAVDVILCNVAGPLRIRYSVDVIEAARWDDKFANAFAHQIALHCGEKIAGSAFDSSKIERSYQQLISRAKTVDAIENPPIEQDESSWVTARGGRATTFGAGIVLP